MIYRWILFWLSCASAFAQFSGPVAPAANVQSVELLSQVLSRVPATNVVYVVRGRTSVGDWGAPRIVRWDPTSSANTNLGNIRGTTNGVGRWMVDWDDGDLRVFGVVTGSVASASDNSVAIASARNELIARGLPLVIPPGVLYISEPINAGGLVAIRGNGSAGDALESQLNVVAENTSAITNLAHGATVERLHIRSRYYSWAKTATNGWAVQSASGAAQKVRDLYIQGFFGGVNLNAFDSSIEDVEIIAKRPILIGGGSTQSHVSRTAVRGNPFVTGLTDDTSITVASYTGGTTNFTVSDASNLSVGDIIRPRSTTEYPTTITYRYFPRKITAIVGTTVTINYPWDLSFSNGTFEFIIGNGYSAFETTTEMVMTSVNAEWGSWNHIFTPNSGPTASSTINGIHIEGWTLDSAGNNYILNGLNTAVDVSHMDIANLTAFASTGIAVFDPATRGRIGALHVRDFDLRNSIPFWVIRELTQTYGESVVVEEFFNAGADVQRLTADGNQYRNAVADYKIGVGGELVRVEGSGLGKATWYVTGPNPTTGNYVAGDDIVTPTNGVQTVITTGSFRTAAGSNRVYQGSARLIVDATARGVLGRRTPVTVSGRQLVVKDQLRSSPDQTTLASAVAVGDQMLPVVSASGFQQGDPVIVVAGATFNDGAIARTAGNYIWLTQPLTNAFSSGATVLSTMGLYEASPVSQTNFVALAFTAPTISDFRSADGKLTAGSSLASAGLVVVGGVSGLPIVELRRQGVGTNAILANGGLLRFRDQSDARDMLSLSADTNAAQQYITIGSSTAQTTPRDGIIQGESASGSNVSGSDMIVRPGPGTGNATPPTFTVQVPVAGSSGSTVQSHSPRLQVDGNTTANETAMLVSVGGGALSRVKQDAASGSLYIGTYSGGSPTTGVGVTNVGGVLSGNYSPGSNVTFATNAYGNVTIAASTGGGGSTNGTPVSVDGSSLTAANFSDGGDINFTASGTNVTGIVQANSVALGTDTTGNYAADVTAGTGISVSGSAGEGISYSVSIADGVRDDITVSSSGASWTVNANAVALGTDTTGNYVATVSGTANEISVSGSGSETAAVTLSLPSTIDIGGKTSFEIPNAAAPTVDAFGEIAGDNDAWAASRGAVVFYDGTASTRLVGVLSSDTPSNGQVPKWNTGGTITWEDDSSSGSGSGTVVYVNHALQSSFNITNSTTIVPLLSGTNLSFVISNTIPDGYYAGGFLPLFAGVSNFLYGDLHFRQANDIRSPMWETNTEWNAVGIQVNNGKWKVTTFNTNDFTVLEEMIEVDPTGSPTNTVTILNEAFDNLFVVEPNARFDGDVEFNGTIAATTQSTGTSNTTAATTAFVQQEITAKSGYTLQMATGAGDNPSDSTTYYGGVWALAIGSSTQYDLNKIQIPKTGILRAVYYKARVSGTLGSSENVAHSIRVNNTTDVASANLQYTAENSVGSATGLNVTVNEGDYITLKVVTPAWVTNPTSLRWATTLFIE